MDMAQDRKNVPAWKQFENVVSRILETVQFQVQPNLDTGSIGGFDLIASRGQELWAIEVKYYRTARAQPSLIEAGAARLAHRSENAQTWKAMLVVSCELPIALRNAVVEKYGISVVDRLDLQTWAASDPTLLSELNAILEYLAGPTDGASPGRPDPLLKIPLPKPEAPKEDRRGSELCKRLDALERGKRGWRAYERLCVEIVQYLFPDDLVGWVEQKRSEDGLHRYDYACRLRPTTDFWRFLIDHLNSRYVLFEFKNYSDKIKQGQMLTTEKYLLERGLRRVAFVFSRKGATADAQSMARGAMREAGKLMLVLDDKQVCKMLHKKEHGDDPADFLFEMTDEFMLTLSR